MKFSKCWKRSNNMHDKTNARTFTDTFMPINKFTSNTMTKNNERMTDDNRRIRLQPHGH